MVQENVEVKAAVTIVRVLRLVEYVGERSVVEATVKASLHGTKHVEDRGRGMDITGVTIGEFPLPVLVVKVEEWGKKEIVT
jgi:hypothetical protein